MIDIKDDSQCDSERWLELGWTGRATTRHRPEGYDDGLARILGTERGITLCGYYSFMRIITCCIGWKDTDEGVPFLQLSVT